MKSFFTIFILTALFLASPFTASFAQEKIYKEHHEHEPILIRPTNHDPNFIKTTEKSFYQRENDWQAIIDSTWGRGLPLQQKLNIFDTYATALTNKFDGFLSLGLDFTSWDSIRLHYRNQIDSSTSKGRFGALMTYLSFQLKDIHTAAADEEIVFQTPLNPGTPIFATSGFHTNEHCGVVITITPDSSILVLRTVQNHPLGLQPGDIILGYEGIPYMTIMQQLIAAELPRFWPVDGAASANFDHRLMGAAMNWHLFDTIDILQYSTGNILHLSTAPMINLNIPPMLNNEQVAIQGIQFPDYFNEQVVSYGLFNGTNIGYIYLFSEDQNFSPHPDQQFFQAVNALQNTEGLIIDMRWNEGGWAFFDNAFKILFNESPYTLNGAYRCNSSTLNLCPNNYSNLHQIKGNASSIYDYPIAILLGPTCVSMGDRTAHRFRYHPMVKFFGKPPAASFGLNRFIESFPGWFLRYSIEDMSHLNQPEVYLNRSEFPIDVPVWFTPTDVANGIDTVVERAIEWINNLAHAHDVSVNKIFAKPGIDSVNVTARVENPNQHDLSLTAYLNNIDDVTIDSLPLFDDGMHGDSVANDNLWGNFYLPADEHSFKVSVTTNNLIEETSRTLPNVAWFTTIGPVSYDSWSPYIIEDSIPNPGDALGIKLHLKNEGLVSTADDIEARIYSNDPKITVHNFYSAYGDIGAGNTVESSQGYSFQISSDIASDTTIYLSIIISSGDYHFWSDSMAVSVVTGISPEHQQIPKTYALKQNYPNPFNPSTTIEFDLPKAANVRIEIFNIAGQKVETLVNKKMPADNHEVEFNAQNLSSGIYYYQLVAGDYREVKKMILLK